jgi:tetratricopeptide (TPR) repeat protein
VPSCRLACLLPLVALTGCASTPPPPARPERGPICAVPPKAATRSEAGVDPRKGAGPRPEELLARARQLRAAGDHEGARKRLEQAAVIAPGDAEICFALADLLVSDGVELDRAEAMLSPLPAATPRRDELLGRLAEQRGDFAAAEAAYARQLAKGPDPQVQLRRALALEKLGRLAEAIVELERLRAAAPGDTEVRVRLAEVYEETGRLTEAEGELRALAEASPSRPEGWRRLAALCTRQGFTEKARAAEARAHDAEARPRRDLRPLKPTGK